MPVAVNMVLATHAPLKLGEVLLPRLVVLVVIVFDILIRIWKWEKMDLCFHLSYEFKPTNRNRRHTSLEKFRNHIYSVAVA